MDPITLLVIGGAALVAFMAGSKKDSGSPSQSTGRGTVNTPLFRNGVRLATDRTSVMNLLRNQLPGRPPQNQAGQSPQPATLRAATEINNTNALIRLDGRAEWEPLPSTIRPGALVGTFVTNLTIEGIPITEVKFTFGNLSGLLRTASGNLR